MPFDLSAVGRTFESFRFVYGPKDVALYALACGATEDELNLVLESRGPDVLPTFSVVFVLPAMTDALGRLGGNLAMLVHGAQRCAVPAPLPPEAEVETTARVAAVYDKGKGALAVFETESKTPTGRRLAETQWQIFYRGEGGFGGERGPEAPPSDVAADAPPTRTVDLPTSRTQALLYRWASGDPNPIHLEPDFAASVGFDRPILHGLCTFGHAARAVIQAAFEGDPKRLRAIEGRFTKPVLPGATLSTRVWSRADGARYESSVDGAPVLVRGRATGFQDASP